VATATKALFTVGVVTAAAALGWTLVGDGDAGDDIVPATVAPSDEPTLAADAPVSPDTSAQRMVGENLQSARHHWSERLGAIEAARRKRPGAGAPGGGEPEVLPSAVPPPTDLIPQLAQLGCVDLLPDHPRGRFQVRLHYIGEPDVGTVVESVDILEDTLDAPEFSECWSNSLYLLELGAPEVPVRGAYDLAYNAGDGARVDRALGEIKTFVREHPKYAEEHEELARLLELPDDTPANQWMPEYVEVLGRDPELDSALDALGKPASP
jgi:hypothetical protein